MCSQTFGDSDRKESACNAGDMGSIKDGSGRDLTEAENIKRWQEYTGDFFR